MDVQACIVKPNLFKKKKKKKNTTKTNKTKQKIKTPE